MEPFALRRALDNVRATTPLVHNITNYVTVNDCANALLAIGASPIMSDEPADVADITSICGGLTLNIGTLNERSIRGMLRGLASVRASWGPFHASLDPVGAGASALRTRTASDLLDKLAVSVVRGNMSEAKALAGGALHVLVGAVQCRIVVFDWCRQISGEDFGAVVIKCVQHNGFQWILPVQATVADHGQQVGQHGSFQAVFT